MSVTGKSIKSYRKADLQNDKSLQVVKSFRFAHKASAGDSGFSIYALNVPTEMTSLGFSQPSANDISKANLLFYKNNLSIVSSARGQLNLEYDYVVTSTGISFTDLFGTALDGEIFVCTLNSVATTGNLVADTTFICETGTLLANSVSIPVGQSFKVNQNPTKQLGAVMLFIDGQLVYRNVGNAAANPSADGNYEEVDNGYGDCTLLEMNVSSGVDRTYVVISSWLSVVKPDGSVVETINKQQATIDKVVETLAVVAGVPETDFQAAPTQPQLNQFGDRLIALENNYEEGTWSPSSGGVSNLTGTPSFTGATYTRVGRLVNARIRVIGGLSVTTAGSGLTGIRVVVSGLPGFTSLSGGVWGAANCLVTASPYESLPASVYWYDSDEIFIKFMASGTGIVNGDALTIDNIGFTYEI